MGWLGRVVLVVVVLVAAWFIWDGIAGATHQARGREIRQMGNEYVDVLNSYGPVDPVTGRRTLSRLSDLWEDDTDPTGHWEYSAGGVYPMEPRTGGRLTQREAYDALRQCLVDDGWTRFNEGKLGEETVTRFTRGGGWSLTVYMTDEGNWVGFDIDSAKRRGPRPA